jgi:beta-aspartyl-peptidase (threonine type)
MEGTRLRAGGVCALPPFSHPIAVARAALDEGGHVLYAAAGAERFATDRGFRRLRDDDLITPAARARWEKIRANDGVAHPVNWAGGGCTDPPHSPESGSRTASQSSEGSTVGAVVRDRFGGVAAATSTGGRMYKRPGRVGDSPVLGAGTYADDEGGACSNTGDGEAILRVCLAKTAVDWLRDGMHPEEAARAAVRLLLARTEGTGGVILVDRHGRVGLARSTRTMSWAAQCAEWDEAQAGS